MNQKFYIRAENCDNPAELQEVVLDLHDVLRLIDLLVKQKRNVKVGKKILFLLKDTNPDAEKYLRQIGIKTEVKPWEVIE